MEYKGFLFGHYDSRGGATFIEGTDEFEAKLKYIEYGIGYEQTMKDAAEWSSEAYEHGLGWPVSPFWAELHALRDDKPAAVEKIVGEDFIAPATIESWRELKEGEDIEWLEGDEKLWANGEDLEDGTTVMFRLTQGQESPGEDWIESEYGEDACGVIFCGAK
jgi:hypothetical protein